MRLERHGWLALIALLAAPAGGVLAPAPVHAQQMTVPQAVELLASNDADEVRMGIETLGLIGSPAAVEPLAARIRRGLPTELLATAIDTLGILGRAEAGPVLFELVGHRRPEIRLRAVQAIAMCRPRGADAVLVSALGDSAAPVRAAAAQTLGELRASSAVDSLFLAFERDVAEAGPALAAVARPEDVTRLLAYLGRRPFTVLRPTLLALAVRTDLPARARLEVVNRVGELATPEARALLEEIVTSLPASDLGPVRRAATDTAARIAQ
jgi:HEAT repeat protein